MVAIVACRGNHLKLQNPVLMAGFSFEGNRLPTSVFNLPLRPVVPFERPL
jgi:hypothetical protein